MPEKIKERNARPIAGPGVANASADGDAYLARPAAEKLTGADTDEVLDRRGFFSRSAGMLGLVLSGGALSTFLNSCETDETRSPSSGSGGTDPDPDPDPDNTIKVNINIAEEPRLVAVGGTLQRSFGTLNGGMPVMIAHTSQDVFHAYTGVCTHSGCIVEEDLDGGQIWCACHDSFFDPKTGIPVAGPAPTPLKEYPAEFDATTQILTISF